MFYQVIERFRQLLKNQDSDTAPQIRAMLLTILEEVNSLIFFLGFFLVVNFLRFLLLLRAIIFLILHMCSNRNLDDAFVVEKVFT